MSSRRIDYHQTRQAARESGACAHKLIIDMRTGDNMSDTTTLTQSCLIFAAASRDEPKKQTKCVYPICGGPFTVEVNGFISYKCTILRIENLNALFIYCNCKLNTTL